MFYCKLCCDGKGPDYKCLDNLRTHLSTEEHLQEVSIYSQQPFYSFFFFTRVMSKVFFFHSQECSITAFVQLKMKNRHLSLLAQYDREHREQLRQASSSLTKKNIYMRFLIE